MGEEFELLVASLSRRFISLAPEALEEQLEEALGLVGEFADADSVTIGQRSLAGVFRRTHQWTRYGFARRQGERPGRPDPWSGLTIFVRGERLVLHRLDDLPDEAAPDRASLAAVGVKSLAVFPVFVGSTIIGALSLATLGRTRPGRRDWWITSGWWPISSALSSVASRPRPRWRGTSPSSD